MKLPDKDWDSLFCIASQLSEEADSLVQDEDIPLGTPVWRTQRIAEFSLGLIRNRFPKEILYSISGDGSIILGDTVSEYISWIEKKIGYERSIWEAGFCLRFFLEISDRFVEENQGRLASFEIVEGMKEMLRNE